MPQGTIKKLVAEKGFGFIAGEREELQRAVEQPCGEGRLSLRAQRRRVRLRREEQVASLEKTHDCALGTHAPLLLRSGDRADCFPGQRGESIFWGKGGHAASDNQIEQWRCRRGRRG